MKNLKVLLTNITFAQFWKINKFLILSINLLQVIFISFICICKFLSIVSFFFIFVLLALFLSCSFFSPFGLNKFMKTCNLLLLCCKFFLEMLDFLLKHWRFLIFLLIEPRLKLLPLKISIWDLLFKLDESIFCLFHWLIILILTFLWLCSSLLLYLAELCFIASYLTLKILKIMIGRCSLTGFFCNLCQLCFKLFNSFLLSHDFLVKLKLSLSDMFIPLLFSYALIYIF